MATLEPTPIVTFPPTLLPTVSPSLAPTILPTVAPSIAPSVAPTLAPSVPSTEAPTNAPSTEAAMTTATPTLAPISSPVESPSLAPTLMPMLSLVPTAEPDPVLTSLEPESSSSSEPAPSSTPAASTNSTSGSGGGSSRTPTVANAGAGLRRVICPNSPMDRPMSVVFRTFFALSLLWVTARVFGTVLVHMKQPRSVGEILAGIFLGPTVFAGLYCTPFPLDVQNNINIISTFGIMSYTAIIGMGFDYRELFGSFRKVALWIFISIAGPCLFAVAAFYVVWQDPQLLGVNAVRAPVSLYFSIAAVYTVSAIPVVFAVITQRKLDIMYPEFANKVFAAVGVITAVIFFILGLSDAVAFRFPPIKVVLNVVYLIVYIIGLFLLQTIYTRLAETREWMRTYSQHMMVFHVAAVAAAGGFSIFKGFSPLLGPFLYGSFLPFFPAFRIELRARFEELIATIFLPIFMSFQGLRQDLRLIPANAIGIIIFFIFIGQVSKLIIFPIAVGTKSLPKFQAGILAALFNARGPVPLVIGFQSLTNQVISAGFEPAYVLLSITATLLVNPLIDWALKFKPKEEIGATEVQLLTGPVGGSQTSVGSAEDAGAAVAAADGSAPAILLTPVPPVAPPPPSAPSRPASGTKKRGASHVLPVGFASAAARYSQQFRGPSDDTGVKPLSEEWAESGVTVESAVVLKQRDGKSVVAVLGANGAWVPVDPSASGRPLSEILPDAPRDHGNSLFGFGGTDIGLTREFKARTIGVPTTSLKTPFLGAVSETEEYSARSSVTVTIPEKTKRVEPGFAAKESFENAFM